MGFFSSIAKGVANIASGFLGGPVLFPDKPKEIKQAPQVSYVDYARLRDEAIKGGFNPLTALRNGGSAGFSVVSRPSIYQEQTPLGYGLGQVAKGAFSMYQGYMSGVQSQANFAKQQSAELRLIDAQINELNRRGRTGKGGLGSVLSTVVGDTKAQYLSPLAAEIGRSTVTNPFAMSSKIVVNRDQPDAEMFQTRYGESELAEMAYGGSVAWSDLKANFPIINRMESAPGATHAGAWVSNWVKNWARTSPYRGEANFGAMP